MSNLPAKRQRTDAASLTLSKPFRSPVKNPSTHKSKAPLLQHSPRSEASKPLLQTPVAPLIKRDTKTIYSLPISLTSPSLDHDIATLIRTQQQLEKQLRELKHELDTVEQAQKIELDSKKKNPEGAIDGELVQLILKWRAASRQAAEELFTTVRDRVNRIGGPKVWKEIQDKQREFRSGWNAEPPLQIDSDDENGRDQENEDPYSKYDIDSETANEREAREGDKIDEGEDVEEEFTMGMMLRSLNVPFNTIGYDREDQRWEE